MFCTECGEENRNDRKFCTNCGKQLRDYTKPRENLLMPSDIKNAQDKFKNNKKTKFVYNLFYIIFLFLALASFILAIVLKKYKTIFILLGIVLIIIGLIVLFIKKIKFKTDENKK